MQDQAIAVIGIACRFPGADGPEPFWGLLRDGRNAVRVAPADRWGPGAVGGCLDRVDLFDASFFGISPAEATAMDPRQRLALELAWEALEDAGIVPATLDGTDTAAIIGAMGDDYTTSTLRVGDPAVTSHTMTGLHRAVIANRLSYFLGLRGPSLTVDTGQSSSLVAVHLACESLRKGDSTVALAGGVSLVLAPESTTVAMRFGALSPSGRCHTFDRHADGFVRGEGGAMVVLKTLPRAVADGDPVYCVIRGGAVNNDGRTDGLTVPSADAQQAVIRLAHQHAGTEPADVQYVELHGTGTKVGDPVEGTALSAALGRQHDPVPALVGSVKTNIGHLEGAAGIAGLVKVALCLYHREIPPSLNFTAPPAALPLDELGLRVATSRSPWPYPDRALLAGVSSFGMGGTNCHLVLTDAPRASTAPTEAEQTELPFVLSASDAVALRDQAGRLAGHLAQHAGESLVDVAATLATARTQFASRAVVVARTRDDLLRGLATVARGDAVHGVVTGGEPTTTTSWTTAAAAYLRGMRLDWPAVLGRGDHRRLRLPTYPFQRLPYWVGVQPGRSPVDVAAGSARQRLTALPETARQPLLVDLVRTHAMAVLGSSRADDLPTDVPLRELGMTSMGSVDLVTRLGAVVDVRLPDTLLFEAPTIVAVAQRLNAELATGTQHPTDDLDRAVAALDTLIGATPLDGPTRRAMGVRLFELAGRLTGFAGRPAASVPEVAAIAFASATDEELFAAIDNGALLEEVADDGR